MNDDDDVCCCSPCFSTTCSFLTWCNLLALAIFAGFIILFAAFCFALNVRFPNMYVDEASFMQLDWSKPNGSTWYNLNYNLTTVISIRNCNRNYAACYNWLWVSPLYENRKLETNWLGSFCQGHKNTKTITAGFAGSEFGFPMMATSAVGSQKVDLIFDTEIAIKWGSSKSGWKLTRRVVYVCPLMVPLDVGGSSTSSSSSSNFSVTKCTYVVNVFPLFLYPFRI